MKSGASRDEQRLTGSEQAVEEREADGVEDTAHGVEVVALDDFGGQQQTDQALLVVGALEELHALVHGICGVPGVSPC